MSKITIPEVRERFQAYHAIHPVWGSLHVVLDDENLSDDIIEACIESAQAEQDTEGATLGRILLQMSWTQRKKLSNLPVPKVEFSKPIAAEETLEDIIAKHGWTLPWLS